MSIWCLLNMCESGLWRWEKESNPMELELDTALSCLVPLETTQCFTFEPSPQSVSSLSASIAGMCKVTHGIMDSLTASTMWMIPGQNQSWVSEFILIGFSSDPTTNSILFIVFLLIYLSSVLGNGLIIMLVCLDTQLTLPCTSSSLPSPCWIWAMSPPPCPRCWCIFLLTLRPSHLLVAACRCLFLVPWV